MNKIFVVSKDVLTWLNKVQKNYSQVYTYFGPEYREIAEACWPLQNGKASVPILSCYLSRNINVIDITRLPRSLLRCTSLFLLLESY